MKSNPLFLPFLFLVNVFYQPPPFAHTKLFVMDDHYAQLRSANLDPRSLRLNFELSVEIYDRDVAQKLLAHIDGEIVKLTQITRKSIKNHSFIVKVRDALTWLFSSYL